MNRDLYRKIINNYHYLFENNFNKYMYEHYGYGTDFDFEERYGYEYHVIRNKNDLISLFDKNEYNTIVFSDFFDEKIEEGDIPPNIKHIIFNEYYQTLEKNVIPKGVETIYLRVCHFEYSLNGIFPYGIKKITLPSSFNQKIEESDIPSTTKIIDLGCDYNFPLNKTLPYGIEKLVLSASFNCYLEKGDIPDTVEILDMGRDYDKPLNGNLPNGIRRLILSIYFNQPLKKGDIPSTIKELIFGDSYEYGIKSVFNQPLYKDVIPYGVTHIKLSDLFDQELEVGVIPNTVISIEFGESFNKPLKKGFIPYGVKEVIFGKFFAQELNPGDIPNSVTTLVFKGLFIQSFNIIPESVVILKFMGGTLKKISCGEISTNVEYLRIEQIEPLEEGVIPSSVKKLHLGNSYNHPLQKGSIPNGTEYIFFGNAFSQNINSDVIPYSVGRIHIGEKYDEKINIVGTNIYEIIYHEDKYPNIEGYNEADRKPILCKYTEMDIGDGVFMYTYNDEFYCGFDLTYQNMDIFHKFLDDNFSKNKLFGQVIYKELVEKIFNPKRLKKLSHEYGISIINLLEKYCL